MNIYKKKLLKALNQEKQLKEICEILEWTYNSKGNSRVAIIKKLDAICKYEVIGKGRGTKFIVKEIYEEAKEVKDGRSKDCIYLEQIENIILQIIRRRNFNSYIPTRILINSLNLVSNKKEIEDITINPSVANMFNSYLEAMIYSISVKGLNSLKRKNLLQLEKGMVVKMNDMIRLATKNEEGLIKHYELIIMKHLGFNKKTKRYHTKKIYEETLKKVRREFACSYNDLEYYFKGFLLKEKICIKTKETKEDVDFIRACLKKELRTIAIRRNEEAKEKEKNIVFGEGCSSKIESQPDFLVTWEKLIEHYID